jgi:cytochrome d ubiquinol oxidase subunit I
VSDLLAARAQMALSLGWHVVIACFGVGLPILVLAAERAGLRGDPTARDLARQWGRVLLLLFGVGAVSGTILSFEIGMLWPGLLGEFGAIFGLPFALEAVAFFLEAIFLGLYLYGWERFPPRLHWWIGVPIPVAGIASAAFVVCANAWMNEPVGFDVAHWIASGELRDVDPWGALRSPASLPMAVHMVLAAIMVSGFGVASVYAFALLRGRRDAYHRKAFALAFGLGALATPAQIVSGDVLARFVAEHQPVKLAAMEALYETRRGAPLWIGGIVLGEGEVAFGLEVPHGLSLLAHRDWDATVMGLDAVPRDQWPPVAIVHAAFQVMVGSGLFLLGLSLAFAVARLRRRAWHERRVLLWGALAAGPLAVLALEAGWITTELGRQPWIVYEAMRVSEAVTPARGIAAGLSVLLPVYAALTVGSVAMLTRLARLRREAKAAT